MKPGSYRATIKSNVMYFNPADVEIVAGQDGYTFQNDLVAIVARGRWAGRHIASSYRLPIYIAEKLSSEEITEISTRLLVNLLRTVREIVYKSINTVIKCKTRKINRLSYTQRRYVKFPVPRVSSVFKVNIQLGKELPRKQKKRIMYLH